MLPGIFHMTPRQFYKAIDAGVFGENHVELLGGLPFLLPQDPPHILASVNVFSTLFALASQPEWLVNKPHRLVVGRWRPLADVVILRGPNAIYGTRLARADDTALLVEVAETSSYAKDSGPKLRRYATFRIPVYWIVDLNRRIVEVYTEPFGTGKQAGYAGCAIYREGDQIPVELDGQLVGHVAVSDLLP
jgi:Uma2 family endonuclease